MKTNITKSGSGYFTNDAEYIVSGKAIVRGDGCRAEFATAEEAHEIAEQLASGKRQDAEFDWID